MARAAKAIQVGRYLVGDNQPVFIVAEAGINHNGDFKKAKQIAKMAKEAGAHAVKFQTHLTEKEMVNTGMLPGKISKEPLWDIIKRCELTAEEERNLKAYCDQLGILFLSTPFSREAADQLEKLDLSAYKIGSGELTNLPLLEHVAKKGKPMILSTGMATMSQIEEAVDLVKSYKVPLILMLCTSIYPAKYSDIKLGTIEVFKKKFNTLVGSSDHTTDIYTALGAVAKGACIIEKHVTVSRKWPGPDQKMSLEFEQLSDLVNGAQAVKDALGVKEGVLEDEKPVYLFARASVVTLRDIRKGEKFTLENIWVKRPGDGEVPASDFKKVLGKVAKVNLTANHQVGQNEVGRN